MPGGKAGGKAGGEKRGRRGAPGVATGLPRRAAQIQPDLCSLRQSPPQASTVTPITVGYA